MLVTFVLPQLFLSYIFKKYCGYTPRVSDNSNLKQIKATILISCFLISCNNRLEEKYEIRQQQEEIEHDSAISELPQSHLKSKIPEPFKVTDIESLNFTSSGGSTARQNEFCDTLKSGFFGTYLLIDEDFSDEIGRPVGGTITVHVNSKMANWKSDDTTQTIWKIHLVSDVLSVWDSIYLWLEPYRILLSISNFISSSFAIVSVT